MFCTIYVMYFVTGIVYNVPRKGRTALNTALCPSDPLDLGIDDDEHDYDNVASDEDTDSELTTQNNNNTQRSNRAKVENTHTHVLTCLFVLLLYHGISRPKDTPLWSEIMLPPNKFWSINQG